jgi:NADH:ubiquinone oxidoreductase subunit 2 (subunit N)
MTEIYWLQVIGNLGAISVVALIVMIIALVTLTFGYCAFEVYDDGDRAKQAAIVKWLRRSAVGIAISVVGVVFIPSDKELMAIYGIGGTIDYIKSNDKAKELPDKVVDALTKYLETLNDEKKDE